MSDRSFLSALNSARIRGIVYQVLVVAGVVALSSYLISNTLNNLSKRGIATGFDFLGREAAFGISESMIPYSPADAYLQALAVGLVNTLFVSVLGILLATLLGTLVGIARLSSNWLIARLAGLYVDTFRNVPLLLQLFLWYAILSELPPARTALNPVPGVFLSNRGLKFPLMIWENAHWWVLAAVLAAILAALALGRWAKARQARTGQAFPIFTTGFAMIIGLPALVFLALGAPFQVEMPELRGFNFVGGYTVTPEFTALLVGLVVYTATFIAEIVRSGIQSVPYGQTEAALALGLKRGQVLRLVVLPQALRVVVPPLTSQYLNLTKNSSLAVAIGYPDLVSIANTAINQTGQAIEGVAIIMAAFLTVSLAISGFMNWYNKKVALVTR